MVSTGTHAASSLTSTAGTNGTRPDNPFDGITHYKSEDNLSDPRYGYRHIRYAATEKERTMAQKRGAESWGHASPASVFVAAIGNHWKPGSWQRVVDMVHYTNHQGYQCTFEELMDRCYNPYDSLGAMRNEAIMRATEGYDYLCMVDNDVHPAPELLVNLINRNQPIIAPWVQEPSSGKPLHGPFGKKNTGLFPVRWCVLSMLVFRTNVFNSTGVEFWNNAIGADEGYHFQKLWHYGFNPVIDTDNQLYTSGDPTYPLTALRLSKDDADEFWDKRRKRFLSIPDRSHPNPNETRLDPNGEYLPFNQPRVPVAAQAKVNSNDVTIDPKLLKLAHGLM